MAVQQMKGRAVARVVDSLQTYEGAGFMVHRPFPTRALDSFDPFLLLDEMGPMETGPGEAQGAPDHPHRGFETVTYLLSGGMRHKDSQGNAGWLRPGDVQWMTAGAGVVHSEMPDEDMLSRGGLMHGFQLWVNLPRKDKMARPRYQDIPSSRIPVAVSEDGRISVRVIAGAAMGKQAVIDTHTPIAYLHWTLEAGTSVFQPLEASYNAFAYVVEGRGLFGPEATPGAAHQMVSFASDGSGVSFMAAPDSEKPLSLLLIAGVPLREPVARYGPFVMNTPEEISQALDDFRAGRMGAITF